MDQQTSQSDEASRAAALMEAEGMALKLLDAIEAGRTEREIELDVRALCKQNFGIERDWHTHLGERRRGVITDNVKDAPCWAMVTGSIPV